MKRLAFAIALLGWLGGLSLPAMAERSVSFGDYTIHYNALPTEVLEPSVARAYGIVRSKTRALVNVSVLRKVMGTTGQPVRATVEANATNLNAQLRQIDLREIKDQGAIYYIGEFNVADEEILNFEMEVRPEGQSEPYRVTFQQQFFH